MANDQPGGSVDSSEQAMRPTGEVWPRARRGRCGDRSVFGVLLVAVGVLFLLDNLRIIEARYFFRNFWPLLIVTWGGARLVLGRGGDRVVGAIAVAFGGLLLGNQLLGWHLNIMGLFWPLILIAMGLNMFFRSPNRWHPTLPPGAGRPFPGDAASEGPGATADQSASLSETAIMAGVRRRNVSQTFRGGRIMTVMGSVEIDLRECRLAAESARIDLQANLGQIVLFVPRDWAVESHVSAVMGNVEDRSERPLNAVSKTLILEGTAFMGNIEIRN